MNLLTLFLITQTVYAIIATLFLIVLIALCILIFRDIRALNKKLSKLAETGMETAEEAKDYVSKIGKSIFSYVLFRVSKASDKNQKQKG